MGAGLLGKFPAAQHYISGKPFKLFASQAMTNPLRWVTRFGKKHLLCWIIRWGSDHSSRLWLVGRNQDLEELLLGQICPLATNPQWERAVAHFRWCELQPGLLKDVEWGLEVALALWKLLDLHVCTATVGKGKGHWLMRPLTPGVGIAPQWQNLAVSLHLLPCHQGQIRDVWSWVLAVTAHPILYLCSWTNPHFPVYWLWVIDFWSLTSLTFQSALIARTVLAGHLVWTNPIFFFCWP